MSAIVNFTDVNSDNFFAEMLIKLLGAHFGGEGSTAAGARVVEQFAHGKGSGVHAVDGSGLTRTGRASPLQVVRLLEAMRDRRSATSSSPTWRWPATRAPSPTACAGPRPTGAAGRRPAR